MLDFFLHKEKHQRTHGTNRVEGWSKEFLSSKFCQPGRSFKQEFIRGFSDLWEITSFKIRDSPVRQNASYKRVHTHEGYRGDLAVENFSSRQFRKVAPSTILCSHLSIIFGEALDVAFILHFFDPNWNRKMWWNTNIVDNLKKRIFTNEILKASERSMYEKTLLFYTR